MPVNPASGAFWEASPTEQDAAAVAEASPTEQDAAAVAEEESRPPTKKPRNVTGSASSAPAENFDWGTVRITGLNLPHVAVATPPAADGPGGVLDEAVLEALRNWYVHKFNAPKSPDTLEIEATAKGEVVRCSLDWDVCSDEVARLFRSGSHSLGDLQPVVIATYGSEKILQLPQVYTQHHMPTAGDDPRSLVELGE